MPVEEFKTEHGLLQVELGKNKKDKVTSVWFNHQLGKPEGGANHTIEFKKGFWGGWKIDLNRLTNRDEVVFMKAMKTAVGHPDFKDETLVSLKEIMKHINLKDIRDVDSSTKNVLIGLMDKECQALEAME